MIRYIDYILPDKNTPIGFAVSMGVDSVAGFLYLQQRGYKVVPIHYNHNLRNQNDLMQNSFIEFAKLYAKNGYFTNKSAYSSRIKRTEAECREERLEYFAYVCYENSLLHVVTAHHLDDYVEGYLLNCFRGQAKHAAINLTSDFAAYDCRYTIVHPFLLSEKKDFQQYVDRFHGGKYKQYIVRDETNDITKGSRRNWIRNIIIPELTNQKISLKRFCRDQIDSQIQRLKFSGVFSP